MMKGDSIQDFDEKEAKAAFEKVKKAPDNATSIVEDK